MEIERQQFHDERNERLRLLMERQAHELQSFDDESIRMGFNALSITESNFESCQADESSVSGSTLSLAHSNSASSFAHEAM